MRAKWRPLNLRKLLSVAITAAGLSACGVKMNLNELGQTSDDILAAPIGVSSFFINEISPTSQDPLTLGYGSFTGTPVEFCLLENDTNATGCVWTLGSPPSTYSSGTTEGNVTLSLWLKDAEGSISSRMDSNLVAVDRIAPQVASFAITNSSPTTSTTYNLSYGAITGTYTSYCIRENNTSISGCTWITGTVPGATVVSSTAGAKTLSLWLRDSAGNISTRRDTAAVILDNTAPSITLTSLTGGQTISGGGSTTITWTASDANPGATPILIEVSSNSGSSWSTLAANEANDGTYAWNPVPAVNSATYRVRVTYTDAAGNSTSSASSADFTISTAAVVVTLSSPNGGEVLAGGSSHNIAWDVTNLPGGASTADLAYSIDGGSTWTPIATGIVNTASNTYAWNPLPSVNENDARIRVQVTDSTTAVTTDVSDGNFTIDSTAPALASVTVTNSTPTTVRTYMLMYGAITDTYAHYCIQENNTAVGACVWTAGTLPYSYLVDSVEEAKVLSIWLRDAAGNVSARRDSNSVSYASNLQLSPATFTAALSNTTSRLTTGIAFPVSLETNGKIYSIGGYFDNVGGSSGTTSLSDVKAYDPATDQWKALAPMHERRAHFDGVVLSDGRIWVGGGLRWTAGANTPMKTTEIYDPLTDRWTKRADMPANRYRFAAGVFTAADGTERVAVIGGKLDTATTVDTIYLYNPVNDTWSSGPTMSSPRSDAAVTKLDDGTFFVGGGMNSTGIKTYGIYDPIAGTYTAGANSAAANHERASAIYVRGVDTGWTYDVILLFGGGIGTNMNPTDAVDMLRLDTGTWSSRAPMSVSIGDAQIVPLGGDKLLRIGGSTGGAHSTGTQEYDVSSNTWSGRTSIPLARGFHRAHLLSNGKVLAYGGVANGYLESLPKNFLFTQGGGGSWAEGANFFIQADRYSQVKLADGSILRCGGYSGLTSGLLRDCYRYDPQVGGWDTVGKMATARQDFTMTLLPSGAVLAAGGRTDNSNTVTNSTEIYNPATKTWSNGPSFTNARRLHKAVLLDDGDTVLLAGGNSGGTTGGTYHTNAQKYSISGNSWSAAGTMNSARGNHALVKLNDGRVFAAGGFDGSTTNATAETYDPVTNAWTAVASPSAAHGGPVFAHVGTGANERVYLSTGFDSNGGTTTDVTEYYDVTTNAWVSRTAMPAKRWGAGFFASEDGFIYVFGGVLNAVVGGTPTATVYRYSIAADTWTSITALSDSNTDSLSQTPTSAMLLDDGRVLIGGIGNEVRSSELYSFVTTQTYTATGGDLNHSLSLFSGPATFYPKQRLYVPHSADFSARGGAGATARIQVTDGLGATEDADITIP